jgi:hypothetical protein
MQPCGRLLLFSSSNGASQLTRVLTDLPKLRSLRQDARRVALLLL